MPRNLPEYLPAATLDHLKQRSRLLRELRLYFESHGYWEVETPLLSQDTCVDAWLNPFEVATPQLRYLQTSPEFGMKRLLAAGADRIYQVTRSFRAGEVGDRHNPEFTIVEWYQCGISYRDQIRFTDQLVRHLHAAATEWGLAPPALPAMTPCWTYDEAFARSLGTTVLDLTDAELVALAKDVVQRRLNQSLPMGVEANRDDLLNYLLALFVEPVLAAQGACFLCDFPSSQAALAQIRHDSPPVAKRFELYLAPQTSGAPDVLPLEICNGYQELTEAAELRQRQQRQNARRMAAGLPQLPLENRLLAAMDKGFPESSGVALGFDRLVMWLLRQPTIQDVQAFPWPRD